MNKIIVVIGIFTIAFISFTIGYKYGDSNGYDARPKNTYSVSQFHRTKDPGARRNPAPRSIGLKILERGETPPQE